MTDCLCFAQMTTEPYHTDLGKVLCAVHGFVDRFRNRFAKVIAADIAHTSEVTRR
jgi:hypothetical protein